MRQQNLITDPDNEYLNSDDELVVSDFDDVESIISSGDQESDENDEDNELSLDIPYLAKDGTQWERTPPQKVSRGRRPAYEIIRGRMGILPYAASRIEDEVTAFKLSFFQKNIDEMIIHSNEKGKEKFGVQWTYMDAVEMDAFLGLNILAAAFKSNTEALESLWDDETGRPIFRATMSLQRFRQIFQSLRFDCKTTREQINGGAIRSFLSAWNNQQSLLFAPYESMTIDEQLSSFRGKFMGRIYMKSKPTRYGLRWDHLVDSRTSYENYRAEADECGPNDCSKSRQRPGI